MVVVADRAPADGSDAGSSALQLICDRAVASREHSRVLQAHARDQCLEAIRNCQRSRHLWRGFVGPIFVADVSGIGGAVLVVDDDEAVRASFSEVLRVAGFEVVEAADGFAALETLRERSVAAIVLDVNMPVLDGFAVLDRLDGPPPPVVLVTAGTFDGELTKRRDKFFGFVKKPVRPESLIALVQRAVFAGQQ